MCGQNRFLDGFINFSELPNGAGLLASQIDANDVAAYLHGRHTRFVGAFECKNHRGFAYSVLLSNDNDVSTIVV